jgi:hypothetical protein
MAELKIFGKTLDELKEGSFPARLASAKAKAKAGQIANRTDFSDEKIGPKFKADTKPVKKITNEKVSIETPSGDIGSVDRTADVIGPDMSKVIKDVVATKPAREFSATEMAQNLMSPGYNKMKKGGAVKTKCMSSGGSTASKRADGCAVRGKTKGKMY